MASTLPVFDPRTPKVSLLKIGMQTIQSAKELVKQANEQTVEFQKQADMTAVFMLNNYGKDKATRCTLANATGVRLEFVEAGSTGLLSSYKPPPMLEPGEVASFLVDNSKPFQLNYNIQVFQGPSRGWVAGEALEPPTKAVMLSTSTAPSVIESVVQVMDPMGPERRPMAYPTKFTFVISPSNVPGTWKVNVEQSITTYVKGIESLYRHDNFVPPPGFLHQDTNEGFGGDWIYCGPIITSVEAEACTGFKFLLYEQHNLPPFSTGDLSRNAGGNDRHIVPLNDPAGKKVTRISWVNFPSDQTTEDINQNRGGLYLYLKWHYD